MVALAASVCDFQRALGIVERSRSTRQHVQNWLRDESVLRSWYAEAEANPRRMLARIDRGDVAGRLDRESQAELLLYCHDLLRSIPKNVLDQPVTCE